MNVKINKCCGNLHFNFFVYEVEGSLLIRFWEVAMACAAFFNSGGRPSVALATSTAKGP